MTLSISSLKNKETLWLAFIILLTIVVYSPSLNYSFYPKLDDGRLILENQVVKNFPSNFKAVFTEFVYGLYHPLTTLSFSIDYKLFGDNPFGFRLHNLLLHLLNIILVFIVVNRITKKSFIAIFTTAIFALHPLHIESVVWISERKDVLYSFYFLLSIFCYLKYKETKKSKYLLLTSFLFFLSLLSKATAVVLPIVLIIIDYVFDSKFTVKQFINKWYLLLLSLVFGIINIKAQNSIDFIQPIAHNYNLIQLITIPVYSFTYYITHLFAPLNLTAKHLFPRVVEGSISIEYYLGWLWFLILAVITYSYRKNKLYLAGILIYAITIGLVLKIIPTGNDIVSERYSYIPYIGLGISVGAIIESLFTNNKAGKLQYVCISLIILLLAILSSFQLKTWKNEQTIWAQVIKIEPEMPLAYYERGNAFYDANDYVNASKDYAKTISLSSNFYEAYIKIGLSAYFLKDNEFAFNKFSEAIALNPKNPEGYYHRGNLNLRTQKLSEAIEDFNTCIQLNYNNSEVFIYKANAEKQLGEFSNAIKSLLNYLKLNTGNLKAINDLAQCYYYNGQFEEAKIEYEKILSVKPDNVETKYYLANTLARLQKYNEAIKYYNQVIEKQPNYAGAFINRGNAFLYQNKMENACRDWQTAFDLGAQQAEEMIIKHCK